jgi:integrase
MQVYFILIHREVKSLGRETKRSAFAPDEEYEKVCQENKDLLNEFVEYCQSTDKSLSTIPSYVSDIKICFCWNLKYNANKKFVDFNKRDIMKYQNYLLNTLDLSSNRIKRLKAAISSMSNFIESMLDDLHPKFRNIVNKIPAPAKEMVREKTILSDEQAQGLLDYLVENKQYQKACVFALSWASGSRKSELLRFKVSYFVEENIKYGSLYKTPEKIKTKGRGKQGKPLNRFVLIGKFKPYFDLWMEERKKIGVDEFDELFVTKRNNEWHPMKISTLDSWADQFSKYLGIDFYFHCMRHNFTTGLSAANVPASVIKEIIGWESIDMVNLYDDTEIDDKLEKYFDENGVKKIEKKELSDI